MSYKKDLGTNFMDFTNAFKRKHFLTFRDIICNNECQSELIEDFFTLNLFFDKLRMMLRVLIV